MGKLFLWKGVWWKKKGLEKKVAFVGKFFEKRFEYVVNLRLFQN